MTHKQRMISVNELTFKRVKALAESKAHEKQRHVTYSELLTELLDQLDANASK